MPKQQQQQQQQYQQCMMQQQHQQQIQWPDHPGKTDRVTHDVADFPKIGRSSVGVMFLSQVAAQISMQANNAGMMSAVLQYSRRQLLPLRQGLSKLQLPLFSSGTAGRTTCCLLQLRLLHGLVGVSC